jgi:hypothetical protein
MDTGQESGDGGSRSREFKAMIDQERRHLAQAYRPSKDFIARQKELIRRMAQRGQSTEWAEHMLEALDVSLRVFEQHRKLIVSRLYAEQ